MNSPFASRLISRSKRPLWPALPEVVQDPGFRLFSGFLHGLELFSCSLAGWDSILSSVKRFETGAEQADDITILSLRFSGA